MVLEKLREKLEDKCRQCEEREGCKKKERAIANFEEITTAFLVNDFFEKAEKHDAFLKDTCKGNAMMAAILCAHYLERFFSEFGETDFANSIIQKLLDIPNKDEVTH